MSTKHKHQAHHVMPVKLYLLIWGALLFLTYVTVQVSYFDFGSLNVVVAVAVATVKALLVALYFMHLRYDSVFNQVIFFSSVIFLALFLGFTLLDNQSREVVRPTQFTAAPAGGSVPAATPTEAAPAAH